MPKPRETIIGIVWTAIALACVGAFVCVLLRQPPEDENRVAALLPLSPSPAPQGPAATSARSQSAERTPEADSRIGIPTQEGGAPSGARESAETPSSLSIALYFYWEKTQRPVADLSVELRQGVSAKGEVRTAKTGERGACTIRYPSEWTEGTVSAWRKGAYAGPHRVALSSARELSIPVMNAYSAHGRVFAREKDGNLRPVEGARVAAASDFPQTTFSGRDGSWRLGQISKPDTSFIATSETLSAFLKTARGRPVHLEPGVENGPFDLVLTAQEGLALSGAVLRADDLTPIADAVVSLKTYGTETLSGRAGLFVFEPLPPGEVELAAAADGFADAYCRAEMKEGQDSTAIFHMRPEGRMNIWVSDKVQSPVPGATVNLSRSDQRPAAPVETNKEGRAVLTRLDSTLEYYVSAVWRGRTSSYATVQFPPGKTEIDVNLTMPFDLSQEEVKGPQAVYEGTVTDEGHWPIAGATVLFRRHWEVDAGLRNVEKKVVAGRDGRFRAAFDEPASYGYGGYEIGVVAEGWGTQWKNVETAGTPEDPLIVNFALRPERAVRGLVVDSGEMPLAGVKVEAWPEGGYEHFFPGQPETFTSSEGRFWMRGLEGDRVRMFLRKAGYSSILGQVVPTDEKETRFVMKSGASIRGRVVDAETRQAIPDFTVHFRGLDRDDARAGAPRRIFAEDGRFVVGDLTQGAKHWIRVESARYAPEQRTGVEATADTGDEEVFFMSRLGQASGIVVETATGRPISDVSILSKRTLVATEHLQAFWTDSGVDSAYLRWSDAVSAQTDADGWFAIEGAPSESSFLFWAPTYAPLAIVPGAVGEYTDSASGNLRIPLGRGARVAVTFVLDGVPRANHRVTVTSASRNRLVSHHFFRLRTDAAGAVLLDRVPPGSLYIPCYDPQREAAGKSFPWRSRRLDVMEGESVTVNLGDAPGAGAIWGVVRHGGEPFAHALVVAEGDPAYGLAASTEADAQGAYRISGLPPGQYSLEVREPPEFDSLPALANPLVAVSGQTRRDIEVPRTEEP